MQRCCCPFDRHRFTVQRMRPLRLCLIVAAVAAAADTVTDPEQVEALLPVARCKACEDAVQHVLAAGRASAAAAAAGTLHEVPTFHRKKTRSAAEARGATLAARAVEALEGACVAARDGAGAGGGALMFQLCEEAVGDLDDDLTLIARGDAAKVAARLKTTPPPPANAGSDGAADDDAGRFAASDKALKEKLCLPRCPVRSELAKSTDNLMAEARRKALAAQPTLLQEVLTIFRENAATLLGAFVTTVTGLVLLMRCTGGAARDAEAARLRQLRGRPLGTR